jgi:putative transposase
MVQVRNIPKRVAAAYGQPERMRFGKKDRIILSDDIDWRCESSDEFGHVLRTAHDKNARRAISHSDMRAEAEKRTFQHDRDWYSAKAAKKRLRADVSTIRELGYLERQLIMWKESLILEIERLKATEPEFVSHGSKKLPEALRRAQAIVIEQNSKVADNGKRKYFGRLKNFPQEPPCMKTFLTWRTLYIESDRDPLSLRSGKHRSGRYDERMTGEQLDLIDEYSRKWLSLNKPSKLGIYHRMKAHIENTLNPARVKKKQDPIEVPSKGRFMKALDDMDAIETVAGREGIDAATRLFQSYADGKQDVERALQEVEIDHWNVGLMTILKKARIWHRLNRKSRRRLETVRMVLGAAICRRTRCLLGMILSRTPSVESALRLIEMAISNKRRFAEVAGCITPYDVFGIPESIWFDGGPAFNNAEVRSVLRDLKVDWDIAPGGLPHLRASVERLFGIIDAQAISWFEGRTFSDVVAKGDYDPGKRTDTSVEELGRVLVRFVVDRHHNTPREYLGGEAPREAYLRLSKMYPIWGAPGVDALRNVFGFDIKRKIDKGGTRFLNIRYRSAELHELFMKRGSITLTCRVHFANLAAISVKIGKKWLTVPGPKEFDGVDAETWIAAEAAVRAKMKTTEKTITGPIINAAILDIADMADEARRRARIDDSPMPKTVVLALEKRMRVFADFPDDREEEPASNQAIYATAIKTGRRAPDPDDDAESDDIEEDDRPKAKARRAAPRPARGRRGKQTPSKPTSTAARKDGKAAARPRTKPARKTGSKSAAAAPGPGRSTGVQRRPGLKRNFTARD